MTVTVTVALSIALVAVVLGLFPVGQVIPDPAASALSSASRAVASESLTPSSSVIAEQTPPPISGELPPATASVPPRPAGIAGASIHSIASLTMDFGLACQSFAQDPEMGGSFGLDCRAEEAGVSTSVTVGYWALDYVDDLHAVVTSLDGGDVPAGAAGELFSALTSSLLGDDAASWVTAHLDDAACSAGCSAHFGASRITVLVGERGAHQVNIAPAS